MSDDGACPDCKRKAGRGHNGWCPQLPKNWGKPRQPGPRSDKQNFKKRDDDTRGRPRKDKG